MADPLLPDAFEIVREVRRTRLGVSDSTYNFDHSEAKAIEIVAAGFAKYCEARDRAENECAAYAKMVAEIIAAAVSLGDTISATATTRDLIDHLRKKRFRLDDTERALTRIAEIIEQVDQRCSAFDEDIPPTLSVMTQDEISAIYALAKGHPEDWRPT